MFTASRISSIAISIRMTLRRFKKIRALRGEQDRRNCEVMAEADHSFIPHRLRRVRCTASLGRRRTCFDALGVRVSPRRRCVSTIAPIIATSRIRPAISMGRGSGCRAAAERDDLPGCELAGMCGRLIYSRYLFPFEIAGLILLVAMIGAIVLNAPPPRRHAYARASKQVRRGPGTQCISPGEGR